MSTTDKPGQAMHSAEEDARREAARMMGSARTERKTQATRQNIGRVNEKRQREGWTEEERTKLRQAQAARRERERQERIALGLAEPEPKEKKRPGRPRTRPTETAEKRPRGRPKKDTANISPNG